jgi:urease accessory protein
MNTSYAAPELAPYQNEPKQMPSGVVGKNAFLRLGFQRRGERSALIELDRRVPLMAQKALYWDEAMPNMPCVFIITTSGSVLQGDRYTLQIDVAAETQAHVTTQAATKIHSMDANFAAQSQEIVLGENAYLEYLPEAVIPHAHARYITNTRISLPPSATLLYSETILPGRKYHKAGELFAYDLFSSTVRAERPSGSELFTEKYVVEPGQRNIRQAGVMGEFDVYGNVLLMAPKEHTARIFEQTPAIFNASERWAAGASRLPNDAGLIYKVVGMESQQVRAIIRRFWALVRQEVMGAGLPNEFLWR